MREMAYQSANKGQNDNFPEQAWYTEAVYVTGWLRMTSHVAVCSNCCIRPTAEDIGNYIVTSTHFPIWTTLLDKDQPAKD